MRALPLLIIVDDVEGGFLARSRALLLQMHLRSAGCRGKHGKRGEVHLLGRLLWSYRPGRARFRVPVSSTCCHAVGGPCFQYCVHFLWPTTSARNAGRA